MKKDTKKRNLLTVETISGKILAYGTLYIQGNIQILWREDIGYTGEQYANISLILGILPGGSVIKVWDKPFNFKNLMVIRLKSLFNLIDIFFKKDMPIKK